MILNKKILAMSLLIVLVCLCSITLISANDDVDYSKYSSIVSENNDLTQDGLIVSDYRRICVDNENKMTFENSVLNTIKRKALTNVGSSSVIGDVKYPTESIIVVGNEIDTAYKRERCESNTLYKMIDKYNGFMNIVEVPNVEIEARYLEKITNFEMDASTYYVKLDSTSASKDIDFYSVGLAASKPIKVNKQYSDKIIFDAGYHFSSSVEEIDDIDSSKALLKTAITNSFTTNDNTVDTIKYAKSAITKSEVVYGGNVNEIDQFRSSGITSNGCDGLISLIQPPVLSSIIGGVDTEAKFRIANFEDDLNTAKLDTIYNINSRYELLSMPNEAIKITYAGYDIYTSAYVPATFSSSNSADEIGNIVSIESDIDEIVSEVVSGGETGRTLHPDNMAAGSASYGMTDTMGRMHSDAQFASSSLVEVNYDVTEITIPDNVVKPCYGVKMDTSYEKTSDESVTLSKIESIDFGSIKSSLTGSSTLYYDKFNEIAAMKAAIANNYYIFSNNELNPIVNIPETSAIGGVSAVPMAIARTSEVAPVTINTVSSNEVVGSSERVVSISDYYTTIYGGYDHVYDMLRMIAGLESTGFWGVSNSF